MKAVKEIPSYEGYAVDVDGNVYSRRPTGRSHIFTDEWRLLHPGKDTDGYMLIILQIRGKKRTAKVHHLILETFIGERPQGFECSHKNGIRSDNRLSNLEWSSRSGNINKKKEHGTYQFGENNPQAKLNLEKVNEIRRTYAIGHISLSELGRHYGVCGSTIHKIITHRTWYSSNETLMRIDIST